MHFIYNIIIAIIINKTVSFVTFKPFNSNPKRLIFLIIMFFTVKTSFATCIVGVFVRDTLYIGADTRTTTVSFAHGDTTFSIGTKIHQVGDCFFVAAGIKEIYNFKPGVIIRQAIDIRGNFIQKIENVKKVIPAEFDDFIKQMKSTNRKELDWLLSNNKLNFTVLIAGIFKSRPRYCLFFIEAKLTDRNGIKITWNYNYFPTKPSQWFSKFYIEDRGTIKSFFEKNISYPIHINPVTKINFLLNLAIASDCSCGKPIDILCITPNGHKWIQKHNP